MKEVKILETKENTIKVLGVVLIGKAVNLHIKINGVDLLENLDATQIEVTLDKDEDDV